MGEEAKRARPIGGWLVLAALGVLGNPLTRIYFIWEELRTLASDLFGTTWFYSVYAIEGMLVIYGFVVWYYFFLRKRLLPVVYQAFLVTNVVGVLAIQSLGQFFFEAEVQNKPLVHACMHAAIWIPYFQVSKRVRATFVN